MPEDAAIAQDIPDSSHNWKSWVGMQICHTPDSISCCYYTKVDTPTVVEGKGIGRQGAERGEPSSTQNLINLFTLKTRPRVLNRLSPDPRLQSPLTISFGPRVGEGGTCTFLPKGKRARGDMSPGPKLHDSTDPDGRGLPPETEPCEPISLSGTRPGTLHASNSRPGSSPDPPGPLPSPLVLTPLQ